MIKSLAATVSLLALATSAQAADLPSRKMAPMAPMAVPIFTWTGLYAGVHAGYTFGDNDIDTSGVLAGNIANVAGNRRPASVSTDRDGFIGGGQIGYNYQFGQFVLGAEADISYTDSKGDTTFTSGLNDRSTFRHELDYLGTVRGRVGVAFDRVLVYATGGFAYGDVTNRADFFSNAAGTPLQFTGGTGSKTQTGYAVGGGVEYALPVSYFGSNAITLRAEYLYYDLGDRNVVVNNIPGVGTGAYVSKFETNGQIVRAGLNFKFGTF